ncbi:YesN/AraC family two-component response regulator [Paenibacillus phyllosphaerae]|uniref:YesN/AraC family two-component response regulator n=1 Tax=Paenibacillus phyllosphaerae TaxID=274593 RepID=A0A7W5FKN4_9BACL|nr:response regulator [Paenibacillus phyllosphaerae]MBB3108149.1 YesN/AraC family two-component response regulator [Paenibacillus phyllosphaerae]
MKNLSVMIVDDEILAIEHLKSMIDWESEGFQVIGEYTHPLKALAKVPELRPDLIIADIRMPHLDGIEFSKRVFAAGLRCRIILLTSYKEFDYVKEAISIGVTEYLVKHDLEPESLRRELIKVRTNALEDRRRSSMVLRQYLKALTDGNELTDEFAVAAGNEEKVKGREFTYLLLSADEYFPVLPTKAYVNQVFVSLDLPRLPLHEIEAAYQKDGRFGYVLSANPITSRLESIARHAEAVTILTDYIQNNNPAQRIVVAYSRPFQHLAELYGIHRTMMERLTAGIYFGDTTIINPDAACWFMPSNEQAKPNREGLVKYLDAGDSASVEALLHAWFDLAVKTRSIPYLSELCEAAISALDAARVKRGLPSLKGMAEEGIVRSDQWRTLEGIKSWLLVKMEETLSAVTRQGCSRKIRETMDYISAHCSEELSAESIAIHLGISGEHLRHLFKQETGQTLLDYITIYRIEKAKSLLESGHFKLYEISRNVGYKSSHYFSKVFSKLVGMSPLDYAEARGIAP